MPKAQVAAVEAREAFIEIAPDLEDHYGERRLRSPLKETAALPLDTFKPPVIKHTIPIV
jgi:hypothetical protein